MRSIAAKFIDELSALGLTPKAPDSPVKQSHFRGESVQKHYLFHGMTLYILTPNSIICLIMRV